MNGGRPATVIVRFNRFTVNTVAHLSLSHAVNIAVRSCLLTRRTLVRRQIGLHAQKAVTLAAALLMAKVQ